MQGVALPECSFASSCMTRFCLLGKLNEAEVLYREALGASRSKLGDGHRSTVAYMNNLANLLKTKGATILCLYNQRLFMTVTDSVL